VAVVAVAAAGGAMRDEHNTIAAAIGIRNLAFIAPANHRVHRVPENWPEAAIDAFPRWI
jgi:hypothetical protein